MATGFRVSLFAAVAALVATLATPSSAASTRPLWFDNQGEPGQTSCSPNYVLVRTPTHGNPCGHTIAVVDGNGYTYTDQWVSMGNAVGFRLDARRHLTGKVYLANYMYINVHTASGPLIPSPPGPLGAKITIFVNNVEVGTASGSGVASSPDSTVPIAIDLAIPRSLNRVAVKAVVAEVAYTTGLGVTSVSYAPGAASVLNFPSA